MLQALLHPIPVEFHILVHQDVPKPGEWGYPTREIGRQDSDLAQAQDRFIVVTRLLRILQGDYAMSDIDAALRCDLQVALHDVSQVGIGIKLGPRLRLERL